MNNSSSPSNPAPSAPPDRTLSPEQTTQVIEAIVDGKYSWACVLILQFIGYNPLDYIPYRTYARIVKDNLAQARQGSLQIDDLGYLDSLEQRGDRTRYQHIQGGNGMDLPP